MTAVHMRLDGGSISRTPTPLDGERSNCRSKRPSSFLVTVVALSVLVGLGFIFSARATAPVPTARSWTCARVPVQVYEKLKNDPEFLKMVKNSPVGYCVDANGEWEGPPSSDCSRIFIERKHPTLYHYPCSKEEFLKRQGINPDLVVVATTQPSPCPRTR